MQLPVPTTVTTSPSIVAINKFELVYVNAPVPFVVGGINEKLVSPKVFVIAEKLLRTVGILLIVNNAVIVPDTKLVVLSCSAVIVEVPLPTMVIVFPSMVATSGSELV